ncbi:MAG TPA: site-2 protease family protein [Alphaproteobacteria bacterium]|nr:site-2 protease family protein [Alphaproteobacteria bacterium]
MFGKHITLFRLFGFVVKLDASWVLLAMLVTWSLATGYFPTVIPGLAITAYWSIGVMGALGLFASIIFHEMCHSLVARVYGLPINGITLFIFGGVAEMEGEPRSPKVEFLMAIAGPISSYALALGFFILASVSGSDEVVTPFSALLGYLAMINTMLATFNLIPAFPLDGGRVLRAALWQWKGNMRWATRHAARIGSGFGLGFVALGVLSILQGEVAGGIWIAVIGLFLNSAAGSSYTQLRTRQALEGQPVGRYMSRDPITVSPYLNLRELVDNYVYVFGHDLFPVVEENLLLGSVGLSQIKHIPQTQWQDISVREIMSPCSPDNMIDVNEDAVAAIALMQRTGNSRLLVLERGRLAGIVALKDILRLLALKLDLETPE